VDWPLFTRLLKDSVVYQFGEAPAPNFYQRTSTNTCLLGGLLGYGNQRNPH